MLTIMSFLLISLFATKSLANPCCEIVTQIYQLETNTTAINLQTHDIKGLGSFGISYGFRYFPDETGSATSGVQDLAALWHTRLPIISGKTQSLVLSTDLKLGQTIYEKKILNEGQNRRHGFFESNIAFLTRASIDPLFSLGIGVGWRVNFLDGKYTRKLKDQMVYADWLYPMMYFGWSL